MSAWMVNKEHIDVLVSGAVAFKLVEPTDAEQTGKMMWAENLASINYRYPDTIDDTTNIPGPCEFEGIETVAAYTFEPRSIEDPAFLLKQLHCYDYQSCEHHEWKQSNSFALVEQMIAKVEEITGKTAEDLSNTPAYNASAWGVDSDEHGKLILTSAEFSAYCARMREVA